MSSGSSSSSSSEELDMAIFATIQALIDIESRNDEVQTRQKRRYIERPREVALNQLMHDYFGEGEGAYFPEMFRRRYRMRRELFLRIVEGISNNSTYFQLKRDASGKKGFTPIQKCTSAIRQLAYGTAPDAFDEYLKMAESTSRECLDKFCENVIEVYGPTYLRKPTQQDVLTLYEKHEQVHGFVGMLGSIDCMHWEWKNCPVAWQGQFHRGDKKAPSILLEAVASYDLWIWHAFFGVAGANNDINVLNQSPLFNDIINETGVECPFTVNGSTYKRGYYLADGIYPEWATFVKSFTNPNDDKRIRFKRAQEKGRKDIERAFGVLQARWGIIKHPARSWSLNKISNVMYTCIILHNMIVEDEGCSIVNFTEEGGSSNPPPRQPTQRSFAEEVQSTIRMTKELQDRDTHHSLRHDLVEHISRINLDH